MTQRDLIVALFMTLLMPGGGHRYLRRSRGLTDVPRTALWTGASFAVLAVFVYRLVVILSAEYAIVRESTRQLIEGVGGDIAVKSLSLALSTKDRLLSEYGFEFGFYILAFLGLTIGAAVDLVRYFRQHEREGSNRG